MPRLRIPAHREARSLGRTAFRQRHRPVLVTPARREAPCLAQRAKHRLISQQGLVRLQQLHKVPCMSSHFVEAQLNRILSIPDVEEVEPSSVVTTVPKCWPLYAIPPLTPVLPATPYPAQPVTHRWSRRHRPPPQPVIHVPPAARFPEQAARLRHTQQPALIPALEGQRSPVLNVLHRQSLRQSATPVQAATRFPEHLVIRLR